MNAQAVTVLQSARELYLTTTGRASGRPRAVELWFAYQDGYVYFLAGLDASGTPTHWCRNLQAHPDATVAVGGQPLPVRLEQAQDAEALRRHVLALFRKKYGAATMRQWYQGGNQLPLKLRVVA